MKEKYKVLTDVEHILLRPATYIGNTTFIEKEVYIFKEGIFKKEAVKYSPGFVKLFDEIFSNSVDEFLRDTSRNFRIDVDIDESGEITVRDNGGIPVRKHTTTGKMVPEMLFSTLRAGSNFDDTEQRNWVGTNGLGATLVNIFSTKFSVRTCDGKKEYFQSWTGNSGNTDGYKIAKAKGKGFTEIKWTTDWKRFGMDKFNPELIPVLYKRICDAAGYLSKEKISIYFQGNKVEIPNLVSYAGLYENNNWTESQTSGKWNICVSVSDNPVKISIINGAECSEGSSALSLIEKQIYSKAAEGISKKTKLDVRPADVSGCLSLILSCNVPNPIYSSQTKEKLINPEKDLEKLSVVSESFIRSLIDGKLKEAASKEAERREARKLQVIQYKNKARVKRDYIEKHIEASGIYDSKKRQETMLILCEGDSPITGLRKFRDPVRQGGFPLRGKSLNVNGLSPTRVLENKELSNIMSILGLEIGVSPFTYKDKEIVKDKMRYHEIRIYTDADVDGNACAALLINFFYTYWPELFTERRIARCETPILIAASKTNPKDILRFYYQEEYEEWAKKNNKSYNIEYFKGLGSLSDIEYKNIIQNPKLYYYESTAENKESLEVWFGDDSEKRKAAIFDTSVKRKYK